jgi:GDPmannose 4,6-dehydratase
VKTNPKFFRPAEVDLLIGDYSLAAEKLGWKPTTTFQQLVNMMVDSDVKVVKEALANGQLPPMPPA